MVNSRSELRTSLDPMSLHPKNSVWSHALDSEPTCITAIGDDFCFVLRGKGIYRMDKHANEVWRSNLPSTIDGNLRGLKLQFQFLNLMISSVYGMTMD